MSDDNVYSYLFVRDSVSGPTEAALLRLTATTNHIAAFQTFRRLLTRWIRTTPEGREAWEESVRDLNIGDLCWAGALPGLRKLLPWQGILGVECERIDFAMSKNFDLVLPDCEWVIRSRRCADDWWNNDTGWGSFETATRFAAHERDSVALPIEGIWERVDPTASTNLDNE